MDIFTFCIILLTILFFMIFCYQILINKNKIIGYQTIKDYNEVDYDLCNQYEIQMDKFKKCMSCSNKLKCHNIFTNTCENCISMGIGQCKMPINPRNNFCKNSL